MICHTEKYTIGRIMTQWSTFDLNPVYQRQGGGRIRGQAVTRQVLILNT